MRTNRISWQSSKQQAFSQLTFHVGGFCGERRGKEDRKLGLCIICHSNSCTLNQSYVTDTLIWLRYNPWVIQAYKVLLLNYKINTCNRINHYQTGGYSGTHGVKGHEHSALKALLKGSHTHSEQELLVDPSHKRCQESLHLWSIHNPVRHTALKEVIYSPRKSTWKSEGWDPGFHLYYITSSLPATFFFLVAA